MRLLTFNADGGLKLGLKSDAGVIDVAAAGAALGVSVPATVDAAIAGGNAGLAELASKAAGTSSAPWLLTESGLTYGPSAPNPGKIICIGLNYRKHAEESGAAIPTSPVI